MLARRTKGWPYARIMAYAKADGTTDALAGPTMSVRTGLPAASTAVPRNAPLQSAKSSASLVMPHHGRVDQRAREPDEGTFKS